GKQKRPEILRHGLNLQTLEMIPEEQCAEVSTGALPRGWKLAYDPARRLILSRPDKQVTLPFPNVEFGLTKLFKNKAGKVRLLVVHNQRHNIAVVDPDTGKDVGKVGGSFYPVYDLAVSPGGKYVVVV